MNKKPKLEPCENPKHRGNAKKYHTGKRCIEAGCTEPAGTAWLPLWCMKHNAERIKHISASLERMVNELEERATHAKR